MEVFNRKRILGKYQHLTPLSRYLEARILPNNNEFHFSVVTFLEEDLIETRNNEIIEKCTRLGLIGFSSQIEPRVFGLYPPFDFGDFVIDGKRKTVMCFPLNKLKFTLEPFDPSNFK